MSDQTHVITAEMGEEGRALYDRIMREIEPELATDRMPLLTEKYKNETPEQAAARAERYNAAFEEYERRFAAMQGRWNGMLENLRHFALQTVEQEERAEEADQLSSLDDSIQAA